MPIQSILPKETLIINDLFIDERTKHFQKLEPYEKFRFYAGSPLITSRGFSIGTLCVIDDKPKNIEHNQIEGLRLLADQVIGMLERELAEKNIKNKDFQEIPDENDDEKTTKYFSTSSILFSDFVGFTKLVEIMEPGELIETLNTFFKGF